jgi:hypothetical protein
MKSREKTLRERERERERLEEGLKANFNYVHDTLSWLFVHFKSLLSVLETVQSRCFVIYQAVLLKFDSIVVAVMLEYVLGYIRPLSILLQSESCD